MGLESKRSPTVQSKFEKRMYILYAGCGGISAADVDGCKDVLGLFRKMHQKQVLTTNNIVVLQGLIWSIGRKDLYNEMVKFASQDADVIHIITPAQLRTGQENVKIHVKGEINRERMEDIRSAAARWLCIPDRFVVVTGVEPTGSWFLTLMIPIVAIKRLKEVFLQHIYWFLQRDIDKIEFPGDEIDLTRETQKDFDRCAGCLQVYTKCPHRLCHGCCLSKYERESALHRAIKALNYIKQQIGEMKIVEFLNLMKGCHQNEAPNVDPGRVWESFNFSEESHDWSSDIALLRELVWLIRRTDLYEQLRDLTIDVPGFIGKTNGGTQRNIGCVEVNISSTTVFIMDDVDDFRAAFSRWLCIQIFTVKIYMLDSEAPSDIVLDIPRISAEHLPRVLELHSDWLKERNVLCVRVGDKTLYEKGADLLCVPASVGDTDVFRSLPTGRMDKEAVSPLGEKRLHLAAHCGHKRVVSKPLLQKADKAAMAHADTTTMAIKNTVEVRLGFRKFLKELADDIPEEELDALKRLMTGKKGYGRAVLQKITTVFGFFERLETSGDISACKTDYLKELLEGINREDLCNKVEEFKKTNQVFNAVVTKRRITQIQLADTRRTNYVPWKSSPRQIEREFQKTLLYLANHLQESDLRRMKMILKERLGRERLEECMCAEDIFKLMENHGLISAGHVEKLFELLHDIQRIDLYKYLIDKQVTQLGM